MRVVGRGYRDGVHNLEVMLESLGGGRRREIQEDGIDEIICVNIS